MKSRSRGWRIARLAALVLGLGGAGASLAQHAPHPAGHELGARLEPLLAHAREANPELAAMRFEADAARERVEPAGALMDPKFRTEFRDITRMGEQSPTLAPARVGSTRYLVMQDVPWYGKRDLKREIAEADAKGAEGRAIGTWSELAAKIKTTFAQLYATHRVEKLAREQLDLLAGIEGITRARYAGGLAAQQDAIRAQMETTELRRELVELETERHHLEARLNALLARPGSAPLAIPEQLRALPALARLDFGLLAERVQAKNPQLFAEESRIRSAEKSRELAYRNRYPDFTLGVSPIQYQGSVREWELMVELNVPLQQASRRAQEREAEAMLSAARARRDATANQVLNELSENLAALDAARRTETLIATSLQPQSELTFEAALAGYETGKVDFATLLDAQRQIRKARQDRLKSQLEAQMRLAEVERIVGEEL